MASVTIKITEDNRSKILSALTGACANGLEQIGAAAARYASANAVRDTGALADSMMYSGDDKSVSVGSPLEYAPYVELGTGPNYQKPPGWITNTAQHGHHAIDPWRYFDEDDGEWKWGWFVTARPFLQPAMTDHAGEYKDIFENALKNG